MGTRGSALPIMTVVTSATLAPKLCLNSYPRRTGLDRPSLLARRKLGKGSSDHYITLLNVLFHNQRCSMAHVSLLEIIILWFDIPFCSSIVYKHVNADHDVIVEGSTRVHLYPGCTPPQNFLCSSPAIQRTPILNSSYPPAPGLDYDPGSDAPNTCVVDAEFGMVQPLALWRPRRPNERPIFGSDLYGSSHFQGRKMSTVAP